MKNKKSTFSFKKKNNNAAIAYKQATMYATHWMNATNAFNKFIEPIVGYTVKCPNISKEVRLVYRMFA